MAHTFDAANADRLEDIGRFRYCSRDELVALVGPGTGRVADLGSGTGFYTRELAPHVDTLLGVDAQEEMHRHHRQRGVAANVRLLTAEIEALPIAVDRLDAAVSTMTFHELCTPRSLSEVARVIRPGGRFVNVDWSAEGACDDGPPREERQSARTATELVREAGFEVERATERPETFVLVARVPGG